LKVRPVASCLRRVDAVAVDARTHVDSHHA
jgi:hypothetical protein